MFKLNFKKYGIRSSFSVNYYLRTEQPELTEDKYKFIHNVYCNPFVRNREGRTNQNSWNITITIGNTSTKQKDVPAYLEELISHPESVTIEIDKAGNVTKIEE